jgi:hypothetical protein
MSRSNALALLALAASCALLSLMGCASTPDTPQPTCKAPDVLLQLVNPDGTYLVPDHIALARDGVDRGCLAAR